MIDFEQAFISAFTVVFPDAVIRGCFFHMSQCVWRKVQEAGIQERYDNDDAFALEIKKLTASAFVPPLDVIGAFEDLLESEFYIENEEQLQQVLNYFEDTWIGRPTRQGQRRNPKFSINMWNCHAAVAENLQKTNNTIEGWHRAFGELVGASHTSVWKFLKAIKKEQSSQDIKMERFIAGENTNASRRKYREAAARLKLVDGGL